MDMTQAMVICIEATVIGKSLYGKLAQHSIPGMMQTRACSVLCIINSPIVHWHAVFIFNLCLPHLRTPPMCDQSSMKLLDVHKGKYWCMHFTGIVS